MSQNIAITITAIPGLLGGMIFLRWHWYDMYNYVPNYHSAHLLAYAAIALFTVFFAWAMTKDVSNNSRILSLVLSPLYAFGFVALFGIVSAFLVVWLFEPPVDHGYGVVLWSTGLFTLFSACACPKPSSSA